jgi:hypothetical protein
MRARALSEHMGFALAIEPLPIMLTLICPECGALAERAPSAIDITTTGGTDVRCALCELAMVVRGSRAHVGGLVQ